MIVLFAGVWWLRIQGFSWIGKLDITAGVSMGGEVIYNARGSLMGMAGLEQASQCMKL